VSANEGLAAHAVLVERLTIVSVGLPLERDRLLAGPRQGHQQHVCHIAEGHSPVRSDRRPAAMERKWSGVSGLSPIAHFLRFPVTAMLTATRPCRSRPSFRSFPLTGAIAELDRGERLPGMEAALDSPDVAAVISRYRTCEFATVGRSGTPIAWPAVTLYRHDDGTFVITTSVGLPQKAYNVRRNPKVALLFSDPTGSGLNGEPQVLVRGVATCPDTVATSPEGLEEYWIHVFERQPFGRLYGSTPVSRRLMNWYYQRLVITVSVTGVHTRPAVSTAPLTAETRTRTRRGNDAFTRAARHLAGYSSAVLATLDETGAPWLIRLRPEIDAYSGVLLVDVPPGERLPSGRASLLCHSHDAKLWNLRSFVAVGDLEERGGRWALSCTRYVPGMSRSPLQAARMVWRCRRASRAYLRRRRLQDQPVTWGEYNALKGSRTESPGWPDGS
jgi:pyridoxamine 5'-phosphate oxidase-like protein